MTNQDADQDRKEILNLVRAASDAFKRGNVRLGRDYLVKATILAERSRRSEESSRLSKQDPIQG